MRPLFLTLALVLGANSALAFGVSTTLPSVHFPPDDEVVTQDCTDLTSLTASECVPAE